MGIEPCTTFKLAFLKEHILNWTVRFFDDEEAVASTDFYRALARFASSWIAEDAAWLIELMGRRILMSSGVNKWNAFS